MQQGKRTFGVVFLTIIYCLAVALASGFSPTMHATAQAADHHEYLAASAADTLVCHTGKTARTVVDFTKPAPTGASDPTHYAKYAARIIQYLFLTTMGTYGHNQFNWPVAYRSFNVAYPFHCFW